MPFPFSSKSPSLKNHPRKWQRLLVALMGTGALGYVLFCSWVTLKQRQLIYRPGPVVQSLPDDADFGLPYGLTIAFEDKDSLSIASFASQSRPFSAQEADSLEEVVRRLHEITAPDQNLSDETSEALRALSIKLTQ